MSIITNVSNATAFQLDVKAISSYYRMNSKLAKGLTVVEFVRNIDKVEFLKQYRLKKDSLKIDLVNVSNSMPIFASQLLFPYS